VSERHVTSAHSPMARRPRPRVAALAGLAVVAYSGAAYGQRAYCNLTEVTVERLSNALVLTFVSDGLLQADGSYRDYVDPAKDWTPREVTRVPMTFENARLRTSSFINVAIYPVSHIELTPTTGASRGVGVQATLVLYRPGRVANLEFTYWDNDFSDGHARRGITYDFHLDKGRKSLIAVITSDRNVVTEPNLRRPERLATGPTRLTVSGDSAAVDVYALNVELRRLLSELGAVAGLRFAVDAEVERVVSLTVTRTPVPELLAGLVSTYGLSVRTVDGAYLVTEASGRGLGAFTQTEGAIIRLNYLDPDDAIHLLPVSVLPYLRVDHDHNALAVSGPSWLVEKVRADLAVVDMRPELVELEFRAVEMKSTDFERVALRARFRTGTSDWEADAETAALSFKAAGPLAPDLELQLQALQRAGQAQTRAHVRKVVLSAHTCDLFAGQVQYISVLRPTWGGMDPQLLPVNLGIQFSARPVTGGKGDPICLSLEATVSNMVGEDLDTRMPEVAARTVRTEMRVADGDTIVLATSDVEQANRARRASRILRQTSITDSLFRTRRDQDERTQLFLLLTARTVTDRPGLDFGALKRELKAKQDLGAARVGAAEAESASAP